MYSTIITFCNQHSYQLPCTTHSLVSISRKSTTDITILCVHNNYIFCFVSRCCTQQLPIVSVCSMTAHFCVYNRCQFISTEWCLSTEVTYPFSDGFFAQLWENQLLVWSLKNYEQSSRQCKNTIYCLKSPWWYKVWPHHFWLWKMPAILKQIFFCN